MARPRIALAAGTVLLVTSCLLGAVVPAVLRPQPPWIDVVTQQRSWARTEDWLFGIAAALLVAAWLLLAYSFVELRSEARRRRIKELSSSHGNALTYTAAATHDGCHDVAEPPNSRIE